LDFLSLGDGVVTRRPLELRLCYIADGERVKPWAVFEERKGQKFLCVVQANNDIDVSDGLQMAKEIDKEGKRTLGVLTKLDIMDKGTDARKAFMNEEVTLTLGYVRVKNRSKQDLMD
jgi:hypothetical protein